MSRGVSSSNRSVTSDGGRRSVDAAALQSDIARRFNLPGAAVKRVKYLAAASSTTVSSGSSRSLTGRVDSHQSCLSCGFVNTSASTTSSPTCINCGVFIRSLREIQPSLAELRGLTKAPDAETCHVLTKDEWDSIESKVFGRHECVCPICMESFKQGHEVLLSCSHMYHR
jgi:hypothetical protein